MRVNNNLNRAETTDHHALTFLHKSPVQVQPISSSVVLMFTAYLSFPFLIASLRFHAQQVSLFLSYFVSVFFCFVLGFDSGCSEFIQATLFSIS